MRQFAAAVILLAFPAASCNSPSCAPDLFDVNGVCLRDPPDCGGVCGTYEICDSTQEPFRCKCAPGYAGNPCEWVGVVMDPRFERLEDANGETYWVDEDNKGATVLSMTDGPNGGGEGFLFSSAVCSGGALSQIVEMPPHKTGEPPLMVEVTYQATNVDGFAVGFDRAWKYLPETTDGWKTVRFCLGEAAYGESPGGGPIKIQLSASEQAPDCFTDEPQGTIRIDHFVIEPPKAEESCVEPGSVLNGDADVSEGGWRFTRRGQAEGALVEGAGRKGSDGVRLFRPTNSTGLAAATTEISVLLPDTLPSPALRFWWRGTTDRVFQVEIGTFVELGEPRRSVDRLLGNNAELNNIYCLPPWTHGNVVDLTFSLIDEGLVEETELLVDEVELVSDLDCGDSTELLDPGFESAPNRWLGTYIFGSRDQTVIMQDDEMVARTDNGVLALTYWTSEAEMRTESFVFVPASNGAEGPQLVFHSDVPAIPETAVEWVLGRAEAVRAPLVTGGGWQRNEVCLPPEWSDRWFRFQVRVGPSTGAGDTIETKRIFLDDFELTTSTDCDTGSP